MEQLYQLQEIVRREGLFDREIPFQERYVRAINNGQVRSILDIEQSQVSDLSALLGVESGRVYAVRHDLHGGVDNHKKEVVAGLILRGILKGRIPNERIDTFIDAGNVNSANAVRYYAERFGMKGMYIMSRHFPEGVIEALESDTFTVVRAPHKYDDAREREFYEHLIEQMGKTEFRMNKFCLLHAKYGGQVAYPFGREVAAQLEEVPSHIVSCLGAGSTLEGLQLAVQDHFLEEDISPSIVIAEHELSPLFSRFLPVRHANPLTLETVADSITYATVEGFPHIVIGPHYDEINPLLSRRSIERVNEVVQYAEEDWQTVQEHLKVRGVSVGNSSAANLSVAARLANEGNIVLTTIFEPFREYYEHSEQPNLPWIMRWETPAQKVVAIAAMTAWFAVATYVTFNVDPNAPPFVPPP